MRDGVKSKMGSYLEWCGQRLARIASSSEEDKAAASKALALALADNASSSGQDSAEAYDCGVAMAHRSHGATIVPGEPHFYP